MSQHVTRICILGGGFGGLQTALRLSQFPWEDPHNLEITLVDQNDRFVFLPLLYELVTGELQTWEIAPPFSELLAHTPIRFCQNRVVGIDLEAKRVQLQEGAELVYDRLVLALGGETPLHLVPGVVDYALGFRTLSDAYQLEERLKRLEASDADRLRIAIAGAGYSGVELACKLADRLGERGRIRLIEKEDQILRSSSEFNRQTAKFALEERGIWLDLETTINRITADTIELSYKGNTDTLPVDLVLWTVGNQIPEVIRVLPLKQNQRGQLTTHPTLQLVDYPDCFALGDLADCRDADGQRIPTTAQSALQQADYTAWNLWASLSDRPLLPFHYQSLGEMMTLGIDNATLSGLGLQLDGPIAHLVRRLVYLYRMPTLEHQLKVGLNWVIEPFRSFLSTIAEG